MVLEARAALLAFHIAMLEVKKELFGTSGISGNLTFFINDHRLAVTLRRLLVK